MNYQTIGRLHAVGEVQSGQSQSGRDWKSVEFVIELNEKGFNDSAIYQSYRASGANVDKIIGYAIGDVIALTAKISASEYNGRWYPRMDAISIALVETSAPQAPAENTRPKPAKGKPAAAPADNPDNDLPF